MPAQPGTGFSSVALLNFRWIASPRNAIAAVGLVETDVSPTSADRERTFSGQLLPRSIERERHPTRPLRSSMVVALTMKDVAIREA